MVILYNKNNITLHLLPCRFNGINNQFYIKYIKLDEIEIIFNRF